MSNLVTRIGIIVEAILSLFAALILLGRGHPVGYAVYTGIEVLAFLLIMAWRPDVFSFVVQVRIILLLAFTPFALGAVHPVSYTIMELMVLFLLIVWMLKVLCSQVKRIFPHLFPQGRDHRADPDALSSRSFRPFSLSGRNLLCVSVVLFLGLTYFQMLPLPQYVLKSISPKTVEVRGLALAGFDSLEAPRTISLNPGDTLTEFYKLLAYVAVFFLIVCNLRTYEEQRAIYVAIVAIGCALAIFGIAQKLTWNGKIYWIWQSKYGGGPFGPYINKNHFAGYMEMAIPLALCPYVLRGAARTRRRHHRGPAADGYSTLNLLAFCPAIVIMMSALCLSLSRGGLLSFSVSMVFVTILLLRRRSLRRKVWAIPLILFMVGMTVNWLGSSEVLLTWDRTFQRGPDDPSLRQRLHIWSDIIRMWKDFPILGVGFGAFSSIYPKYSTLRDNVFTAYTESDHFRLFAETGVLGVLIAASALAAFFTTCAVALRSPSRGRDARSESGRTLRRRSEERDQLRYLLIVGGMAGIVAILAHGWCDFNLFIPANALLFTVIAALTYTVSAAN